MKTIELSAKQRQEIQERRRQAGDRRIFQRLSTLLWIDEGRTREEIAAGVFHNAEQIRARIEDHFGVPYTASGVKDLLHRIGASYHKVSGFFLEGGPGEAAPVRAQV